MTGSQGPARRRMVETPLVPVSTLILSGHDGDDAKPYQERAVRDLLRESAEARWSAEL